MDTKKIYDAQLNALPKINTVASVDDLICRLSTIGPAHWDFNSKSIEIEKNTIASLEDDDNIRIILKEWLFDLELEKETYNILSNNIEFLFNISKVGYPNKAEHFIHVYLY